MKKVLRMSKYQLVRCGWGATCYERTRDQGTLGSIAAQL
jgi:hypothetical protein